MEQNIDDQLPRNLRQGLSKRALEMSCDLAYVVWTPLNQSSGDNPLFLAPSSCISLFHSLSLSLSPTRHVSLFRAAPARHYSHSFAVPVDLCRFSVLSFFLSLPVLLPLRSPGILKRKHREEPSI